MGKQHGTLAKAGKVRKQTPKVDKQQRAKKIPQGRAYKRIVYNRRYANLVTDSRVKAKTPNWHAGRKDLIAEEAAKNAKVQGRKWKP